MNTKLLEAIDIVMAVPPSDFNGNITSDYVCLKNYAGCLVVVMKPAGTAGDDLSLQLYQATDVSASGEKALTFDRLYHKVGAQTGVTQFTRADLATPTADLDTVSVNGVDLEADSVEALFVIDIKASELDVSNGFDCLCFKNDGGDVGNSTICAVAIIPYGARYPGAIPLSSIVD